MLVTISIGGWIEELSARIQQSAMMKRIALIAAGWTLLLLGSVGLFLPVLPGVLFLLVGLSVLSVEYEWARRWVAALRRRFPVADRTLQGILARR
jgi:hypothetical protein